MTRGRQSGQPFSLFAFQDIITSVTGIVILMTLVMTLELLQTLSTSLGARVATTTREVADSLEEANSLAGELKTHLNKLDEAVRQQVGQPHKEVRRRAQIVAEQNERLKSEIAKLDDQVEGARRLRDAAVEEHEAHEEDRSKLRELKGKVAEKLEQLKEINESNRRIYNREGSTQKAAWIIDIHESRFVIAKCGVKQPPLEFAHPSADRRVRVVDTWARKRNPALDYFVLLVRPGGTNSLQSLLEVFDRRGFEVGFDLVASDVKVIDENTGAEF